MIELIKGSTDAIAEINFLEEFFLERNSSINGILYFGYPILSDVHSSYNVDAMLISEEYGVLLFDFKHLEDFSYESQEKLQEFQDNLINSFSSKLMRNKTLMNKRTLAVNIDIITLDLSLNPSFKKDGNLFYKLGKTKEDLDLFLEENRNDNPSIYPALMQSIQAIATIKQRQTERVIKNPDSRGSKLKALEQTISNLDLTQTKAIIETINGPQRIRGLAGSGKTIVLALKVAYLHSKNPDWDIAVTFNTRSLKDQFKNLITKFFYEHKETEPNWQKIKIIHAWGSPKDEGIYYNICKKFGTEYHDLNSARTKNPYNPFSEICKILLEDIKTFDQMYDLILIDEAQDFSSHFLKLCYNILPEPKRLIFAYDELQSLNKMSMDSPENIFGFDSSGKPNVSLENIDGKPKQDIILETCYRNSRPLLATAHALGFGVYSKITESLIQIFDDKKLWKEVGYMVTDGILEPGQNVTLQRTPKGSPLALETHSHIDDIISFEVFNTANEQAEWIANQIEKNLTDDELEYKDILVIHTDPRKTLDEVGLIRNKLYKKGILNHLTGVSTSPDKFFLDNSITFTSIFRAKGNEAAMVYLIDTQNCYSGDELAKKRNILFTGITRSKAWVRMTGVGENANLLKNEFLDTKNNDFKLSFIYPTEEQVKKMNVIHRDKTKTEKIMIKENSDSLEKLVENIKNGTMHLEDIPNNILNDFISVLPKEFLNKLGSKDE